MAFSGVTGKKLSWQIIGEQVRVNKAQSGSKPF